MRPHRLLAVVLTMLALAPLAAGQGSGVSTDVAASSGGEPLAEASPVAPGATILVDANVSTSEDGTYRAFLNVTLDGDALDPAQAEWTGAQDERLEVRFEAPSEEGPHSLSWNLTVQAQETDGTWTEAASDATDTGFRVEAQQAPPTTDQVSIDVEALVDGASLAGGDTVPAGSQILVPTSVNVPDRNDTQWRTFLNVTVDGAPRVEQETLRSGGGWMNVTGQLSAPNAEGDHELSWTVTVQYRDSGDASASWSTVATDETTSAFAVEPPTPPPGPGIPWMWILVVGAAVLAGGGAAYWWSQRDRQIRGTARSKAMQELEGEAFEESEPEPEVDPEMKILEARADDIRRMIELAKERHEAGELTEHQYETIRDRKEDELEEIQAEMDEVREQG